ncbi:Solute carrier family 35 member F5 [Cryptotermes secundus]|uniref:Solute carrier family 35 member F5 n=2 Tax=Cryptotermes secundus TaxID=105785 RepID=A0A2J7RHH1_9NEOP|nr:solute carrier family 35 member F5 [Cryptotermes secundus]PNF40267.1 Solute carrier family 35 member F5 [Cryptotermes secundus]
MTMVIKVVSVGSSIGGMLNKSQRLLLGLFVLLLVDVIWVSSSELTKYIYHNEDFEKPFFSTYVKTSMFTLYLLGLCFWPSWRDQCNKPTTYMYIDPNVEDENFYTEGNTSLSDPTFVPIKFPDPSDRSSGTESDDSSVKSVRFSKLAEVRHMSETDATEALLARLSYQASVRAGEVARRAASKFPIQKVAKISLMFCILWFIANYTYQTALADTEAGIITVLSSTSSLFTLILAALFPSNLGDRFTLSKLVAVCISISGLVLVSLSDLTVEVKVPAGAILALVSAFFYAAYLVFLRKKVDHEDKMDIPMFFGFVGLFNLLLLWPLFFLFHYSKWELFEWPTRHQWTFLLLNGLVGTVLSEVLWLWGCFLTSSLIATVAISLTIPMSMFADVMFKRVNYPSMFYIGSIPMFLAFFAVTLLAHYENWDPVMEGIRRCYIFVFRRNRPVRISDCEDEQTESLIGINSGDHEA